MNGWVILNKPLGMSSTQASTAVKRICGMKKAGHAGTLDPLASGVLPIALGEATKAIPYMVNCRKAYAFRIIWGEARTTEDAEGEVVATSNHRPNEQEIVAILPQFRGEITQIPPRFSAIKIQGKRAYELARAGEQVEMPSRRVKIYDLVLGESSRDWADLVVTCGEGTYVRSLARDIAVALGTLGYVGALERTQVGPFSIKQTILLENLREMGHKSELSQVILPIGSVLDDIPAVTVSQADIKKLHQGQRIPAPPQWISTGPAALWGQHDVIALADFQDGWFHPKRLFLGQTE